MIDCLCPTSSTWGISKVISQKGCEYEKWVNLKTGNLYFEDPKRIIVGKLSLLTLATPIYCTFYIIVHAIKGCVYPIFRILASFFILLESLLLGKAGKLAVLPFLRAVFIDSPHVLSRMIWTIVKTPFYYLALQFAAIYGLVWSPLDGRALFGAIEDSFHGGNVVENHIFYRYFSSKVVEQDPEKRAAEKMKEWERKWAGIYEKIGEFLLEDGPADNSLATTWFLACCFQPTGNLRGDYSQRVWLGVDGEGVEDELIEKEDGSWGLGSEIRPLDDEPPSLGE